MKKVIMMTIMAATISFSAMAQENEQRSQKIDQTEMIQRRTDMMVQRYGLNDDQKAKLLELNKEFADKMPMMGFRNGGPRGMGGGPRGNMGGQRRQGPPPAMNNGENGQNQRQGRPERGNGQRRFNPEAMQQYEAALKGIMTEEQYNKYDADRKARMERRPQRPAGDN